MVTDFIWVLCQGQIVGVKAEAWGLVKSTRCWWLDHGKEERAFRFWVHLEGQAGGTCRWTEEDYQGTKESRMTPRYLA